MAYRSATLVGGAAEPVAAVVAPPVAEPEVPPSVAAFGDREGLRTELHEALCLVRKHFGCDPAGLEVVEDPDSGEQWVSVRIPHTVSRNCFAARYRGYTEGWVKRAPRHKRRKVRLS